MQGDSGKFLNPYRADGTLAPWAKKGVGSSRHAAGVGAILAGEAIAMFVPVSEASTAAENTIKQQSAISASGGKKYMKSTSDTSFNRRQDFAVYLYANHSKTKLYKKTLALLAELYPDMWAHYDGDIRKAKKKPKPADVPGVKVSLHFLPVLPPPHFHLQRHRDAELLPGVHHLLTNDFCV
jgi:hypothetical protein